MMSALAYRTDGGNRTPTLLPELDFESSASTNSATSAKIICQRSKDFEPAYLRSAGKSSASTFERIKISDFASFRGSSVFHLQKLAGKTVTIPPHRLKRSFEGSTFINPTHHGKEIKFSTSIWEDSTNASG